jgi:hypothetical protein
MNEGYFEHRSKRKVPKWEIKMKLGTVDYVKCHTEERKKVAVFWVVALCGLVQVFQCFRGLYCLHHQGSE